MENMSCPLYCEGQRLCSKMVKNIPEGLDSLQLCINGNYAGCPFFKYVNNPDLYCNYFKSCRCCQRYSHRNYPAFIEMAHTWCLQDFEECKRYEARNNGERVPDNLLPDGTIRPD